MNSLADILAQKAEVLFEDELPETTLSVSLPPAPPAILGSSSSLPAAKLENMLYAMKTQIDSMLRLIHGQSSNDELVSSVKLETGERVVEGGFTGISMFGNDGRDYPVPPNYASKSKLVEGDQLKLAITKSGSFIYKQIGPIARRRIIGELIWDATLDAWQARAEGKTYKILTASVTFYKGKSGDEIIFIVPKDKESIWGAVDNIISK